MDRSRLEQLEDLCGRLTGQVCDSKADFAWLIVHGYAIELEQILHGLKTESLLKDSQDNDELTVAYMVGREDGRKDSQGEAVGYVHPEELQRLEHTGEEVIYRDKHQEEFIPVYTAPQPAKVDEYPACSGDAGSCPENEGYGCCKPNPQSSPPDAVQLEKRARELLAEAERGPQNDYGHVHRRIAQAAIASALIEAKQQGPGEAVRWEARRKNTITGKWCDWNDCSQKFHDEIVRGETPPGLQARALYTTPPQGEAKRQTAAAVPDGEVRDPHHGGSCSWKWEGGNLFHQSPGSSGWVKCKKIGATPARISAVYQALIAATPAASEGEKS